MHDCTESASQLLQRQKSEVAIFGAKGAECRNRTIDCWLTAADFCVL